MTVEQAQVWLAARMVTTERGPGVLATILEAWSEGTPESPISVAETLSLLTERFPGRKAEGMLSSIFQAKHDLKMKKGIIVEGTAKTGFYVKAQLIKE